MAAGCNCFAMRVRRISVDLLVRDGHHTVQRVARQIFRSLGRVGDPGIGANPQAA